MKRFFSVIVLAAAVATSAFAQPKAIGGRLGGQTEVSYQHYVGNPNFIEATLGADFLGYHFGALATATYNFTFAQPNWTDRGDWAWFAGPGIATGWVSDRVVYKEENVKYKDWDQGFMLGLAAQVGLSYTFWFPLQLSVSVRPIIGFHINDGWKDGAGNIYGRRFGFYEQGISWNWAPTLSVHYAF